MHRIVPPDAAAFPDLASAFTLFNDPQNGVRAECMQAFQDIETLKDEARESAAELERQKAKVVTQKQKVETLKKKLEETDVPALEQEIATLKQTIAGLEARDVDTAELEGVRAELETATEQLTAEKAAHDALKVELNTANQALATEKAAHTALQTANAALQQQFNVAEEMCNTLQAKVDGQVATIQTLNAEIAQLKAGGATVDNSEEIEKLQKELDEVKAEKLAVETKRDSIIGERDYWKKDAPEVVKKVNSTVEKVGLAKMKFEQLQNQSIDDFCDSVVSSTEADHRLMYHQKKGTKRKFAAMKACVAAANTLTGQLGDVASTDFDM
jgi:chromosome segregation ATPase